MFDHAFPPEHLEDIECVDLDGVTTPLSHEDRCELPSCAAWVVAALLSLLVSIQMVCWGWHKLVCAHCLLGGGGGVQGLRQEAHLGDLGMHQAH